jgi:hypothetical protein
MFWLRRPITVAAELISQRDGAADTDAALDPPAYTITRDAPKHTRYLL